MARTTGSQDSMRSRNASSSIASSTASLAAVAVAVRAPWSSIDSSSSISPGPKCRARAGAGRRWRRARPGRFRSARRNRPDRPAGTALRPRTASGGWWPCASPKHSSHRYANRRANRQSRTPAPARARLSRFPATAFAMDTPADARPTASATTRAAPTTTRPCSNAGSASASTARNATTWRNTASAKAGSGCRPDARRPPRPADDDEGPRHGGTLLPHLRAFPPGRGRPVRRNFRHRAGDGARTHAAHCAHAPPAATMPAPQPRASPSTIRSRSGSVAC